MKYLIIFAIIGASFFSLAEEKLPNIVILYADDLGYGDLTCYNPDSKIPTKYLDSLAKEGMRFTDGHSSSGICTPSRYALLTGRYHWRDFHGIVGPFGKSVFKSERLTLPEMLKEKGYFTGAIGKWHLGWDWDSIRIKKGITYDCFDWSKPIKNGPLAQGFDYYFGDTVINFPPYTWIENDKVIQVPTEELDIHKFKKIKEGSWECRPGPMYKNWDPYQNIPITTEKGVEFIKEKAKSDTPFFLYFAYPSPHAPIIPNDEFDNTSKAGPYGDFVVETDYSIGKIMAAIEASGEKDNTIIIFSADNGAEAYCYERDQQYNHWSSAPFRGVKRDVYEGGHRVPFIISYPGVTKPNSVNNSLVSQIDIMATLAEIINFKMPAKNAAEDSKSMLHSLKDETKPVREMLVNNTYSKTFGMRLGDWMLITGQNGHHNGIRSGKLNEWLVRNNYAKEEILPQGDFLYNLKTDVDQRHNLASKYPEKVIELKALLQSIKKQHK